MLNAKCNTTKNEHWWNVSLLEGASCACGLMVWTGRKAVNRFQYEVNRTMERKQAPVLTQISMFTQNWRDRDPSTSVQAAANVNAGRGLSQRLLLLVHYAKAGERGLTSDEAGDASGLSAKRGCCYWKRVGELVSECLLEDTSEKRRSQAGELQIVRRIVPAGYEELQKLGIDWKE